MGEQSRNVLHTLTQAPASPPTETQGIPLTHRKNTLHSETDQAPEQAAQNQLREGELTLFRDWCEYVCFAHFLSDKLNVQKIRRPF